MTPFEIKKLGDLHIGKLIITNRKSKREISAFVENSSGEGIIFKGINKTTNKPNSIKKYLYFHEIDEVVSLLKKSNQITFSQIESIVNTQTRGGCVTHVTIIIITIFLKVGIADYKNRLIRIN